MRANRNWMGVGALVLFLATSSAWAYIPPSSFIVSSLAKKHAGYKSIQVRTVVSAAEGGGADLKFRETTLFYPHTGVLRSRATTENGQVLFETERKLSELPLAAQLLFDPNGAHLLQSLKSSGIPVRSETELRHTRDEEDRRAAEQTSLKRWNRTMAWVIGSSKREDTPMVKDRSTPSTPQLWVEKDSFFPVRVIAPESGGSRALYDLNLEKYKTTREFPYPRSIVWENAGKQVVLKAEATEVAIDGGDSELAKAKPAANGFTEAASSAPAALRDLIRAYYTVLR